MCILNRYSVLNTRLAVQLGEWGLRRRGGAAARAEGRNEGGGARVGLGRLREWGRAEEMGGWRRVRMVLAPNKRIAIAISVTLRNDHDKVNQIPNSKATKSQQLGHADAGFFRVEAMDAEGA